MTDLIKYLKTRKLVILLNVCLVFFIWLTFWLFDVKMIILAYVAVMWFFILLIIAIIDFGSFSRKLKLLKYLEDENIPLTDFRATDEVEKEYVRLLRREYESKQKLKEQDEETYNETVEYFTIWAHQIKTPISAISLVAENIPDDDASVDIRNGITDINDYVDMVLNYLRLGFDVNDLVFDKVNADKVIKQLLRKFSSQFITRGINISYESKEIRYTTDEKWLSFIIGQVLSNALKYSRKGGTITITADERSITVKDQGIGISPEDLPRVFEKGYTGYNGRQDKKSTGIGLYLVKRACDLINAGISIESKVGEGTTVTIRLDKEDIDVRD
ncbi:MAG: sensor histidine kinase [Clostridiales bacterium]|nr:sensor histidine kinase [Clostridiales bacterium]